MVNLDDFDLLPSERVIAQEIQTIGVDRARKVLEKLRNSLNRRAAKWNSERVYKDFAFDAFYVAKEWELDLLHRLKMGVSILDSSNTPYAAHQRILQRIKDRDEKRAARNKLLNASTKPRKFVEK